MVTNKKVTGKAASMGTGLAMGGLLSVLWTVAGAVLLAKLMESGKIGMSALGWGAMGILMTASLIGALLAAGKIKRRRIFVCGASGLVYYLVLIAVTALFFGGQYSGMTVTAAVIAAGCGAAALLGAGKGRKKRPYQRKGV